MHPEKGSFSYFHGAFLRGSVFVLCVCNIRTLPTWTPPCSENFTESFIGFLVVMGMHNDGSLYGPGVVIGVAMRHAARASVIHTLTRANCTLEDPRASFAVEGGKFNTVRLPSEVSLIWALRLSDREAPNPVMARATNLAYQVSLTGLPSGIVLIRILSSCYVKTRPKFDKGRLLIVFALART